MFCKKIKNIVKLLLLASLFLSVPHHHVQASASKDTRDKNLFHKGKNPQVNETLKVSKPKKVIVISVPNGQKSLTKSKERIENRLSKRGFKWSRSCLTEKEIFKNREEAEEYLGCLLEERKVLEGDFFGINLTAYRYVNIFYRMGFIRYKIFEIEKEIKLTKSVIRDLEK